MYKDVYKVACTYKLPARLPVQQNNLLPNTLVVCQQEIYGIHRSTLFTCYRKCDEFTDGAAWLNAGANLSLEARLYWNVTYNSRDVFCVC